MIKLNLKESLDKHRADIDEVNAWADSEYDKYFAPYFKGEVELYNKMKSSTDVAITDTELEWILTDLPLELFTVTEQLSKLKTAQEVIKVNIKQREREYIANAEGSMTQRKEEASTLTAEDKLLVDVYESIAERVSKQMSFSKELIMSAKKIWDARRADGILLPEVSLDKEATIPEYDFSQNR